MSRRLLTAVAAAAALALAAAAPSFASQPYPVSFHAFPLGSGTTAGTTFAVGSLRLAKSGLTTTSYSDPYLGTTRAYQIGTWTSPVYSTGFGFTELVSSWNAQTPAGTFIRVFMRAPNSTCQLPPSGEASAINVCKPWTTSVTVIRGEMLQHL